MSTFRIDAPSAALRIDSSDPDCGCSVIWQSTENGPRAAPCACEEGNEATTSNVDAGRNDVADARAEMIARNLARSRGMIGATRNAPASIVSGQRNASPTHDTKESVVEKAAREMRERHAKRFAVK